MQNRLINARQAAVKSTENKLINAENDLNELIKKAIQKGRYEVTFMCPLDIIEDMTTVAENAGYAVTTVQGGIKVIWE